MTAERHELLDRIWVLRAHLDEDIAVAALMAVPTKACHRVICDLLDGINNLQALLDNDRQ